MPIRTTAACRLRESAVTGILALVATMVGCGEPPCDKRFRPPSRRTVLHSAAHPICRPSGPAGGDRFRPITSQRRFCTIFKNSHIFLDT